MYYVTGLATAYTTPHGLRYYFIIIIIILCCTSCFGYNMALVAHVSLHTAHCGRKHSDDGRCSGFELPQHPQFSFFLTFFTFQIVYTFLKIYILPIPMYHSSNIFQFYLTTRFDVTISLCCAVATGRLCLMFNVGYAQDEGKIC